MLLQSFVSRDETAELAVFERHFKPLCLYAEKICGQMAAAEDIVLESLEKAYRRRDEFETLENLKRFLYRLVHNAAINYSKQAKNHSLIHDRIGREQSADDGAQENPAEVEILRVELLREIYREVENLPDQCRTIFKMIFLENLSTEQIAGKLGLNPQTIRSQKSRAIQLLKTRLLKAGKMAALSFFLSILH